MMHFASLPQPPRSMSADGWIVLKFPHVQGDTSDWAYWHVLEPGFRSASIKQCTSRRSTRVKAESPIDSTAKLPRQFCKEFLCSAASRTKRCRPTASSHCFNTTHSQVRDARFISISQNDRIVSGTIVATLNYLSVNTRSDDGSCLAQSYLFQAHRTILCDGSMRGFLKQIGTKACKMPIHH